MTRWLWILALLIIIIELQILGIYCHAESLPYVVTVTDLGWRCIDTRPIKFYGEKEEMKGCIDVGYFKNYHLQGFEDCVSTSTVQCNYLYDIASDLNRAHNAGFDPDLEPAHPTKIVCHKLVGGMMYSVPCQP